MCSVHGFSILNYTIYVDCYPEFHENKVKIHLRFDLDNPKMNNITNGDFKTQNFGNIKLQHHKLNVDPSDAKKYFIELKELHHNTRYFVYAFFMNKNKSIISVICNFRSPLEK